MTSKIVKVESMYKRIAEEVLKNPDIIRPHVKVKDISYLNF